MTDTVIDGITDYALAALRSVPLLGDPADAELEPAGDPDVFPSLGLSIGPAHPIEREAGLIRLEMTLTVDGYVQRGDGAVASRERTALHAAAWAAIMADDTFGGLIEAAEPGDFRPSTAELASHRRLGFEQDFTVQFTVSRINPALPG